MRTQSVLVVEDERVIARDLQAILHRLGYAVPAIAGTGADAIKQAAALHPDLVLMDIRLQGAMDGIEAAERIHAQLDIPVVYLTAFADDATRQRARQTAPYGYLVKPFDERTVQTTIEMALERHTRDRQVRRREHWLATTLASIGEAIVTTDVYGRITFVNPAAEQILRCGRAEATGAPIADVVVLLDAHTHARIEHPVNVALRSRAPAQVPDGTFLAARDGAKVLVEGSVAPLITAEGSAQGTVLVFQEQAERRRAAAAQRTQERQVDEDRQLERLRVLAGGLAHDFNNLLTVVLGNAALARYELPYQSPAHSLLDQVESSASRAADLTRQLLAYASDTLLSIESLDLNVLVRQAIVSLAGPVLKRVTLRDQLAPDLPAVDVDAAQIRQVVRSLLINAVEAIGETEGTITITTELRQLTSADLARAVVGADRGAGWYVALEIADTGGGMDAATLARIFEPFFSTKFAGRGLGLPAALGTIRQHRGALMVQSKVGYGTTFTLLFPRTPALSATSPPPAAPAASGGPRTVLVVDDEEHIRSIAARMLERLGYAVVTAADGRAALEIFQAHKNTIECVLLDLAMPEMHGAVVADAMRRLNPDIPLIIMSGYSKEEIAASLRETGRMYVLPKPFLLGDLRLLLQKVFSHGPHERGG